MQNFVIPNYLTDLYALGWCLALLGHGIKYKAPAFFIAFASSQGIIFFFSFLNGFLNKGYCLFLNCEPTNTLKQYFSINYAEDGISIIKFISITLVFLVIMKMHRYIEKIRNKRRSHEKTL